MNRSIKCLLAASVLALSVVLAHPTHAHSTASEASLLSALPLASVVVVGGASVAAPVVLSTAGAVLVVKAVEATARGTLLVLESLSDGAQVSVEVIGSGVAGASYATGALVTVSVIGTGVVLSAAGEAIAFIPNAIGNALLHNERLTY